MVFSFSFWVPPTTWEEMDSKKKEKVTKRSCLFAHARERVGTVMGRGRLYPPAKNAAEQANIRMCFEEKTLALDIQQHFPWTRGKIGIMVIGVDEIPLTGYWEGKPHTKKPDCSNMLKQAEDALNANPKTGFIGSWLDDCWVAPLYCDKIYGPYPGVQITLFLFQNLLIQKPATPRKRRLP